MHGITAQQPTIHDIWIAHAQVNQRVSAERLQQLLSSERAKREALATEIDALRAALGRTTGDSLICVGLSLCLVGLTSSLHTWQSVR